MCRTVGEAPGHCRARAIADFKSSELTNCGFAPRRSFSAGISVALISVHDGENSSSPSQLDKSLALQKGTFHPCGCDDVNERTSHGSSRGFFKSSENGIHSRLIARSLGFEPLHNICIDPQRQRCLWRDRLQPLPHNRSHDVFEVELRMLF